MQTMSQSIVRPAATLFILLSVLCTGLYPLVITGIGRIAFPAEVGGSLVAKTGNIQDAVHGDEAPIGSLLIGQSFSSPHYFWSRPSATSPMPNNAVASSGSNLGPLNPALMDAVKGRIDALKAVDPTNKTPIPIDLVTASASGLDPDISIAAAYYQIPRVSRARLLNADAVRALVDHQKTGTRFGFLGEPTVNVLALNIALDRAALASSH